MKEMEVPQTPYMPLTALSCKLLGFPQLVETVTAHSWDDEALCSFNYLPLMKALPE